MFLVNFITNPELRKKGVFPNLNVDGKKSWLLGPKVWLCVGKVLGTPQRLSKDNPLFCKTLIFEDWQ